MRKIFIVPIVASSLAGVLILELILLLIFGSSLPQREGISNQSGLIISTVLVGIDILFVSMLIWVATIILASPKVNKVLKYILIALIIGFYSFIFLSLSLHAQAWLRVFN